MKKIIFVILLSAVSIVGLNADDLSDCMERQQKSACQKVIDNGLISVEQCDKSTCGVVGIIYFIAEKYHQAFPFFEKGCNLKSVRDCWMVGEMYERGEGVKQDFFKAKMYLEKACNLNLAESCSELGVLYYKGKGVKQDESVAKKYFGKACDLGLQLGCDNYKKLNERGIK